MNWEKIKIKYPKSCYLLEKYLGGYKKSGYSASEFEYLINGLLYNDDYFEPQSLGLRCLYDFFDEQGIYCSVYSKDCIKGEIWWNDVSSKFAGYSPLRTLESRKEAEEQIFKKAFEILEKTLTK